MAIVPSSERSKYPLRGGWETIEVMYKIIGLGRKWVVERLETRDFHPELRRPSNTGRPDWCYSPECLTWLQHEAEIYREEYPPMGKFIPMPQAVDELGHSRKWIRDSIDKCRLDKPRYRRNNRNRVTECISPGTLRSLRRYDADYPPAGWYNLNQLHILSGWGRIYISNRLAEAHIKSEWYLGETGGRYKFYHPDALKVIGIRPKHYPPGGDNITEYRMAILLGESRRWVRASLNAKKLAKTAQTMLDDWNRPHPHYTPMVFQNLKSISEREKSTKTPQDSREVG